jgi:hypothetical protein
VHVSRHLIDGTAMNFGLEQVQELAPDGSSLAAAEKLMALKNWPVLGRSDGALWGKCQGSKMYQVKVDLANLGYNCNCPSRKFPCKHVLGLMMLAAATPDAVSVSNSPEWVEEWFHRRQEQAARKAVQSAAPKKPVDEKAQQRRSAKRETQVNEGVERLDLWLRDLVRGGLAGVEGKPHSFWEEQSRRLVDAQAPGLATRVSQMGEIPGSSRDWPAQLLSEAGRLKLLLRAWQRLDELDPDLQRDVRQIIGWNVSQEELLSSDERIADTWCIYGQYVEDDARLRTEKSWAVGRESQRTALLLQFAPAGQPFSEPILAGTQQRATMAFYPGVARQRAKLVERAEDLATLQERIPGHASIIDFLTTVSDALARQPWLSAHGCVLHDVTLVPDEETWQIVDHVGHALPLRRGIYWKALAMTGGHPFDIAGEWDGRRLRPLSLLINGTFRTP